MKRGSLVEPFILAALLLALGAEGCHSAPGDGFVAIDEDKDGRTDLWRSAGPEGAAEVRAPAPGTDPPRTVVLAIDAIPY